MVQGNVSQYQSLMSPRSAGEQSGIFHQMVENVLSSSPGSVNTRDLKFVTGSSKADRIKSVHNGVSKIDSSSIKSESSETIAGSPTVLSQTVPIQIPFNGDMSTLPPLGTTPDFNQYSYMMSGQQGTPVIYSTNNNASHFSSTPTNYGYGSWSAVYPPNGAGIVNSSENIMGQLGRKNFFKLF